MFSEMGYLPLGQAFERLSSRLFKRFAEWHLENNRKYADEAKGIPPLRKAFGLSLEGARDEFWRSQMYKAECEARESLQSLFAREVRSFDVFVFDGERTLCASKEVMRSIHEPSYYEEFWDPENTELDFLDIATFRDFVSLNKISDTVFLFVDPFTWTIDTRAYEAIRQRVREIVDLLEYAGYWEDLSMKADDVYDAETALRFVLREIDNGELEDIENATVYSGSSRHFEWLAEYDFPILKNVQLQGLVRLEGASVVVDEAWFNKYLKKIEEIPTDNLAHSIPYKRDKAQIKKGRKPTGAKEEYFRRYPNGKPKGVTFDAIAAELTESGFPISDRMIAMYESERKKGKGS